MIFQSNESGVGQVVTQQPTGENFIQMNESVSSRGMSNPPSSQGSPDKFSRVIESSSSKKLSPFATTSTVFNFDFHDPMPSDVQGKWSGGDPPYSGTTDMSSHGDESGRAERPMRSGFTTHSSISPSSGAVRVHESMEGVPTSETGLTTSTFKSSRLQQRRDSDLSMTDIQECLQSMGANPSYRNGTYYDDFSVPSTDVNERSLSEKKTRPLTFPIGRTGSSDVSPRNRSLYDQLVFSSKGGPADGLTESSKSRVAPEPEKPSFSQTSVSLSHYPIENGWVEYQPEQQQGFTPGYYSTSASAKSFGAPEVDPMRGRPQLDSRSGKQFEPTEEYYPTQEYYPPPPPFTTPRPELSHNAPVFERSPYGVDSGRLSVSHAKYPVAGYSSDYAAYDASGQMSARPASGSAIPDDYDRGHSESSRSLSTGTGGYNSVENLSPVVSGYDGFVYKV
jgi:hypothetical protein